MLKKHKMWKIKETYIVSYPLAYEGDPNKDAKNTNRFIEAVHDLHKKGVNKLGRIAEEYDINTDELVKVIEGHVVDESE